MLAGRIDPGRVFDFETDLDGIGEAYAAMDERRAVKVARARGIPVVGRRAIDILEQGADMKNQPGDGRGTMREVAPALADYTEKVLFGDVWERPGLSPRDRSLITVATLVALYRTNELPFHLKRALKNGLSREELVEAITHLAFYSGWPTANTAVMIAGRVFEEEGV